MPQKSKASRAQNKTQTQQTMSETADKARKNYEQTIRTGQRLQEEAGQWWTKMLSQTASTAEWQKQFSNLAMMAGSALPMAQRRLQDMMDWFEKNSRTHAELMRKAVEAAQTPVIAESQNKWMDFWTSSMKALQSNVESATEIGTRAIDSWIQIVRDNTEITEIRTPKPA